MHLQRRQFLLATITLALPALGQDWDKIDRFGLYDELRVALGKVERATIFSLLPSSGKGEESFEGWISSGSALLDPAEQARAVEEIRRGITESCSTARCFDPHHGFELETGPGTYRLVICVDCSLMTIKRLRDGAQSEELPYAGGSEVFNALLAAHNLPVPGDDPFSP